MIFAWPDLKELAQTNIEGARGKLMDILCNYQGMKGGELILVFDAYRVQGHVTEILDYHNIHVVYTKEAETADAYIEKFAHENDIRYQDREDTPSVYDLMGENERLRKTTEILKADIENLKERLKLEKKVTGGNTFKESSLKVVADALRKKANSTISNEALIPLLKDVYSFRRFFFSSSSVTIFVLTV